MKKTTQSAIQLLIASLLMSGTAFAKQSLECKTQLARASEEFVEVLPRGQNYDQLIISDEGTAQSSYTFSLRGQTDQVYKLDLYMKLKRSNWSKDAVAFVLESKLWDVKNNKLVAIRTETSDNVRTRYLLGQILDEDTSTISADMPSFELRGRLLASADSEVVDFANQGRWIESTNAALSKALINPYIAEFTSVHCILKN